MICKLVILRKAYGRVRFGELDNDTRRIFREANEEARKPLLPLELEAQLCANGSPIAARQSTPSYFPFSPTRFPAKNVPITIKVVDSTVRKRGKNNSERTGGKDDGGRMSAKSAAM